MTDPLLVLDSVAVAYGRTTVVEDVCLTVPRGSITAVLGPSGCGKTTLLRAVAGLEPLAAGSIAIDGERVASPGREVPPQRRGVGLVPQDGALFPHLSVRGNIGYGLRDRGGRAARVDELIELVGLNDVADRRPAQLSGGQRQRVALARALAPAPSLIGLDEPFSALDAGLRTRLRSEVGALLRDSGATALLVTHDPAEALALADQVVVLRDGLVRQIGTPEELYNAPVDFWVGRVLGELNQLTLDGETVFVRPHDLRLLTVGAESGSGALSGTVQSVEFRGAYRVVVVQVDGQEALIRVAVDEADLAPVVGDVVELTTTRYRGRERAPSSPEGRSG